MRTEQLRLFFDALVRFAEGATDPRDASRDLAAPYSAVERDLPSLLVFRVLFARVASARLTRLCGLTRLSRLCGLTRLSRLSGLTRLSRLIRLTRLTGLTWLILAAFAAAHTSTALGLGHVDLLSGVGRE
jgi:hypothetical protein